MGSEPFEEFAEARAVANGVVESLINDGYEIAGVTSFYDLPAR